MDILTFEEKRYHDRRTALMKSGSSPQEAAKTAGEEAKQRIKAWTEALNDIRPIIQEAEKELEWRARLKASMEAEVY